jgi:hypothetical protein
LVVGGGGAAVVGGGGAAVVGVAPGVVVVGLLRVVGFVVDDREVVVLVDGLDDELPCGIVLAKAWAAAPEVIDGPAGGLVVEFVTILRPVPRVARRADGAASPSESERAAEMGSLLMLANSSAAPSTDSNARLGSKPLANMMASSAASPAMVPLVFGEMANRRPALIPVPSSRPTQITDALRRSVSGGDLFRQKFRKYTLSSR